ncbi:hypothetical protein BELL_0715g00030 [Botrytis elliptica]|uniref:Uncharacterized protein n=1 Tax=Botrytis elliptica TaxID=278938 RepID=A0A4Z1JA65_9HELO|nr:hypothetical protein BELL_0715g00030 [Botrytis elliptica]
MTTWRYRPRADFPGCRNESQESEGTGAHGVTVVDGLRRGEEAMEGAYPGEQRGARPRESVEEPVEEYGREVRR